MKHIGKNAYFIPHKCVAFSRLVIPVIVVDETILIA